MRTATHLQTTNQAYKEISPPSPVQFSSASSQPSTESGPPDSSDVETEVSAAAESMKQVLPHLSRQAPTLGNTVSSLTLLPRTRISSRAKPFVPSGAVPAPATKSVTMLPRTRVSALAKPYMPGHTLHMPQTCPHSWGQYESMRAGVTTYSEQAQEAVYLPAATTTVPPLTAYDERLQDEVYLGVRVSSRTPSPVRLHWASKPLYPEASESQATQSHMSFAWAGEIPSSSGMNICGLGRPNAATAVTEATRMQQQQQQQLKKQQHGQQQQNGLLPVKRTFIHYDDLQESSTDDNRQDRKASAAKRRSASAPGILLNQKAEAHQRGQCRPCAFFFYKADGCRNAADCTFCHICPPGEVKKRRKEKREQLKLLKAQAWKMDPADENLDPIPAWMPERSD